MSSASTGSSDRFIYVVIGVIVVAIGAIAYARSRPVPTPAGARALAQCLTQKGVKFYGAFWCEHCKRQKELFGGAAADLPYVECFVGQQMSAECTAAHVESFPTWVVPSAGSKRLTGEQTFESLAEFSGCPKS